MTGFTEQVKTLPVRILLKIGRQICPEEPIIEKYYKKVCRRFYYNRPVLEHVIRMAYSQATPEQRYQALKIISSYEKKIKQVPGWKELSYYAYGVKRVLKFFYKLSIEESYKGDYDAVLVRMAIESALNSDCLTARQRQAIGLYFFAELNLNECEQVLGIANKNVRKLLNKAFENIASHIQGQDIHRPQSANLTYSGTLKATAQWLDDVANNKHRWWIVPQNVRREILDVFGLKKPDEQNDEKVYAPWLNNEQIEWKQSKEKSFEKIFASTNDDDDGNYDEPERQNTIPQYKMRFPHDKYLTGFYDKHSSEKNKWFLYYDFSNEGGNKSAFSP
jgi:predicted DNA-binding protein (UPF0251 family)